MLLVNEEYKTFLSGREPLDFDEGNLDNSLNIEWYQEQIYRCIKGYKYKGYYITGSHYFLLNFVPIRKLMIDHKGETTKSFEVEYPVWTQADDRIFKQIDEARQSGLDFMFMTGRGWGKTYISVALGLEQYVLYPSSMALFCGAEENNIRPTFNDKLIPSLNELEKRHLTFKQKRLVDTPQKILAGEQIDTGTKKDIRGRQSILERIIFSKEGVTAGRRANFTLFEEIGEFGNNPSLKQCITNTQGTASVGSIKQGFTMYIGTGGSVSSDQARDIFFNPLAYGLYIPKDADPKYKNGHAVFMPTYTKYGGFYERTGYSDEEGAKESLDKIRENKKSDPEAYNKFIQQFPYTMEEVFRKNRSAVFNSNLLSTQLVDVETLNKYPHYAPKTGMCRWGDKNDVLWDERRDGWVTIFEFPMRDSDGKMMYKDLYIAGLDSIDQGREDSVGKDGSKLCMVIKKRQLQGDDNSNMVVARLYVRPDRVEDAYDQVYMLASWYDCKINLEYTKIAIYSDAKRKKFHWRFMERPRMQRSSVMSDSKTLIGTFMGDKQWENAVVLINKYIAEYWNKIIDTELIKQLLDFTKEDKTNFDMVAALALVEMADEEYYLQENIPKNNSVKQKIIFPTWNSNNGVVSFGSNTQTGKLNF